MLFVLIPPCSEDFIAVPLLKMLHFSPIFFFFLKEL